MWSSASILPGPVLTGGFGRRCGKPNANWKKSYTSRQMANLLSPREAALRLGISYPTMKQWLYRGKLKAIKTPGGHYRIPEAELDGLLHKARRPETPKRQMLRTVSGRNQLIGRIVEIKIEGLLAQVKLSIGGQIITSLITVRCRARASARSRRNRSGAHQVHGSDAAPCLNNTTDCGQRRSIG